MKKRQVTVEVSVEVYDINMPLLLRWRFFMTLEYFILISMIDEQEQEWVYFIMSYPSTSLRKEVYWFFTLIVSSQFKFN